MSQPLVSIIIPFYNEEQYLERAVSSAVQQSYQAIEIILIDDGSTDNSLEIAKRLEKSFLNIAVFSSAHHSLGKARNIGLEKATGEFIAFLDSDDELLRFAIERLVQKITEEQSDIVICKFRHFDISGLVTREEGWTKANSIAAHCACGMYEHSIASTVWAKLYKAEIAKRIRFVEGLWFEDRPYLLHYFLLSQKVSFETEVLWKIHSRPHSITRRVIELKRIKDVCLIFTEELNLINVLKCPPQLAKILYRHHLRVLMNTVLILYVDRYQVANLKDLQREYDFWLKDYLFKLSKSSFTLGMRDKLDIILLTAYQNLGWKISYRLLYIFKRKKLKFIAQLKNA